MYPSIMIVFEMFEIDDSALVYEFELLYLDLFFFQNFGKSTSVCTKHAEHVFLLS